MKPVWQRKQAAKQQASSDGARAQATSAGMAQLSAKIESLQLAEKWYALPPRDRLALSVLCLFLLLFVGGYGGYTLHAKATQSKENYNTEVADYFWLRSQAGNIAAQTNNDSGEPFDIQVSERLRQASINNAQVVASGEGVQLSFEHNSQAVVGQAIGQLREQGWRIDRLEVVQNSADKMLKVQAVVLPQ